METELKEAIENLLLQFMQNMHEWEVTCNDIEKQSELSFEEQFNKQKELVSKIFLTYCTPRERKYGKPNTISYGVKGSYEYDVDEEKITDIVDEGKNRIVVNGEKVQLVGFGTFETSERAAREGRNPQTGETMTIKASKTPKFKAGKALKDMMN